MIDDPGARAPASGAREIEAEAAERRERTGAQALGPAANPRPEPRERPPATRMTRKQAEHRMAQVVDFEELTHLENSMSRPIEALAEEVLQLPSDARSRLLDRVVASLDRDRARDAAWDALAAHRDAEIESGAATAVSGSEVVSRLRSELA